jgi:hypothetical protein
MPRSPSGLARIVLLELNYRNEPTLRMLLRNPVLEPGDSMMTFRLCELLQVRTCSPESVDLFNPQS